MVVTHEPQLIITDTGIPIVDTLTDVLFQEQNLWRFSRKQSLKRKDVIFVRGITTRDHLYHDFEDTVYMVPNIVSCITRKLKSTILYMYRKELVKMVTLTTYFKTTEIDEEVTHSVHQKLNYKLNLISNLRK